MTTTTAPVARPQGARRWGLWVGIAAVVVVVAVLTGRSSSRPPLDPRSTAPDGTAALVELLQRYGATVDLTADVPADAETGTRVLVLDDRLTNTQRSRLLDWVDAGGVLVVTDPASALHRGPDRTGGADLVAGTVDQGRCTIDALARLRTLEVDASLAYPIGPDDAACFGDDDHAFVVAASQRAGTVVALGSGSPFTNARLADADNAALATALLVPGGAVQRVVVLEAGRAGSGDKSLAQLISPRVWQAVVELLLAFVVVVLWRSRRLGQPVIETQPVEIAGSELVAATGALLARSHQPAVAAEALRAALRRDLGARYGVGPDAPIDALDAAVTAAGAAPGTVRSALAGAPVDDDAGLVRLARDLDRLREELL